MNTKNRNNSAKRRPVQMLLILTLLAHPLQQGLTNFAASAARTMHTLNKAEYAVANTSSVAQNYQPGDIKVLAEGFHSKITKPFAAVVRDAETYAALNKLDENLPKLDTEFFKSSAVIAAYLGTRNTGGYSVEIRREGTLGVDYPSAARSFIHVAEKAPGKGVMVPQIITSPFKIVSIPVDGVPPLVLSLDYAWRQKQQLYRLTSGSFTMTGGFAGTSEQFLPHGGVLVIRAGGLATFYFSLAASGATKERFLTDSATGIVQTDGQIRINRLSAGSFVAAPNSGLKASGTFTANDGKVRLNFSSLPSMIADGYQGQGSLEAEIVSSTPKQ